MRKVGSVLLVLVLVAVVAWSAAWFYVARRAEATMDTMIAREHASGRDWACPQRQTGGFPFALTVSCTGATYAGQAGGSSVHATLGGMTAATSLADLDRLTVTLAPPFTYSSSDKNTNSDKATSVTGRWQSLVLSLEPLQDVRSAALAGSGIAVDGMFGAAGQQGGKAESLNARFETGGATADPTVGFAIAFGNTAIPALDGLLGGTDVVNATLNGLVRQASVGDVQTPEEALDTWRSHGGFVQVERLLLRRGTASLSATGRLGLDPEHRLQGHLDADFVGLDPILARYGIKANLAAVSSLVNALFGGGKRQAPPPAGAISLPVSFNNGRLGVGPVNTGIALDPLY